MVYIDSHVHTINSPDGHDSISSIVEEAKRKGLYYLCTTDHLDYDLKYGKNRAPIPWNHIDLDKYYAEWLDSANSLEREGSPLIFKFGAEVGFENDKKVLSKLHEVFEKYPFDAIINSVHFVMGMDVYFPVAFFFKPKKLMYGAYLDKVLDSLNAPYNYDIVAHLGYITRNAPYRDKALRYADFPHKFDDILNTIIKLDKALEVNTHHDMNPTEEILRRYYALGGRKISYGSDSHHGELCKDYEKICALLKSIGFTHFSVFDKHREIKVPIG